MKRIFLMCLVVWGFSATAQEVEDGEEKVVIQNPTDRSDEDFYVDEDAEPGAFFIDHKVIQGEQMAMISRKYLIDPKEIYLYNNDAVNGIHAGVVLKIPLHKSKKKDIVGFIGELEKKNGGSVQVASPTKRKKMGIM